MMILLCKNKSGISNPKVGPLINLKNKINLNACNSILETDSLCSIPGVWWSGVDAAMYTYGVSQPRCFMYTPLHPCPVSGVWWSGVDAVDLPWLP